MAPGRQPCVAPDELAAATSVSQALSAMRRAFVTAGIDTPDLDARSLLHGVLGIDATKLITEPDLPLGDRAPQVATAVRRRLAREPVSRILGERAFYGRIFEVSPATLDPRPDTETIVDAVLAFVDRNGGRDLPWRLLDVGTGTGCLAVTLLAELPHATAIGSDISRGALEVAERNALNLGVASRVVFAEADGVEGFANGQQVFDILMSNPPYIPSGDISALDAEVRDYDPRLALDGGVDGLAFYRRLAADCDRLVPSGLVCLEVGFDQAAAVTEMLADRARRHGWPSPEVIADLAGHSRCVAQTTRR